MANISQKWLNEIGGVSLNVAEIFTNNYAKSIYGTAIAKQLKLPQRTVSRKLNKLCGIGLLRYKREGKNKLYYIDKNNPQTYQFLTLIEAYKAVKFLTNKPKIALVIKEILDLCGAIVFGSYAKGIQAKDSDLDIVFLTKKQKKIDLIIRNLPIRIHPQYATIPELKMKFKQKNPLALEIAENHIILGNFDEIIKMFMEYYYG